MSAPGTPKASEAAVAAVQDALREHFGYDIEDDEREAVARVLVDAAAPHIAARALRDAGAEFATRTQEAAGAVREHWRGQDFVDGQDTAYENAAEWCDAEADRIEAGQ